MFSNVDVSIGDGIFNTYNTMYLLHLKTMRRCSKLKKNLFHCHICGQ